MREMIERAAEAFREAFKRPFGEYPPEELHQPWEHAMVRAALLAALDPSDEALRGLVRDAWNAASWTGKDPTRAVIEALHQSISPQTVQAPE